MNVEVKKTTVVLENEKRLENDTIWAMQQWSE